MLAALLRRLRGADAVVGRLAAIYVAEQAGAPMRAHDAAEALPGSGLRGDRYAAGTGFWRATDGCQVTLIHGEDLARAERRSGLALQQGQHRRNLVVTGLAGTDLGHRRLRIGDALFVWHRVRPPCGYLDKIAGSGMAKALGKRSGICLKVIEGGWIRVGDAVGVVAGEGHGSPGRP
ncbi:MAG: MOSC domain-containing protein [Thiohalocapsa sp.]|jgi:MOSC domain-containing protein YiiM|nr:MOSC domain-containing protein [Thiohalocapsa sp.]